MDQGDQIIVLLKAERDVDLFFLGLKQPCLGPTHCKAYALMTYIPPTIIYTSTCIGGCTGVYTGVYIDVYIGTLCLHLYWRLFMFTCMLTPTLHLYWHRFSLFFSSLDSWVVVSFLLCLCFPTLTLLYWDLSERLNFHFLCRPPCAGLAHADTRIFIFFQFVEFLRLCVVLVMLMLSYIGNFVLGLVEMLGFSLLWCLS